MHPQTLRKYERLGLVRPTRTIGSMRVYTAGRAGTAPAHQVPGRRSRREPRRRAAAARDRRGRAADSAAHQGRPAGVAPAHRVGDPEHRRDGGSVMDFKDYYQTLGVTKTASDKEIKQAYRKLARKHHPDVNPGDKGGRGEVQGDQRGLRGARRSRQAAQVRRARRQLADVRAGAAAGRAGMAGRQSVRRRWLDRNMGGGQSGGYRTMTEEEMREMFGDEDPFSDFFKTFFGGGGSTREAGRGRGTGARPEGARHRARSRAHARRGLSRRDAPDLDQGGRARAHDRRAHPAGREGWFARPCGRRGRVRRQRRRRRRSLPARQARSRTPLFERDGNDLRAKVAVPVTTAVLGGEANVPTMTGSVRLKIPETTQNGQVFRLKGHGMPIVGKPDRAW